MKGPRPSEPESPVADERHQRIDIASFDELIAHEEELVRRINEAPHGGRLLILDPLRLMRELNVHLSEAAIADWSRAAGANTFQMAGRETAYDAVARSSPPRGAAGVRVRGLVNRRRAPS